jgi:hypothetical protein
MFVPAPKGSIDNVAIEMSNLSMEGEYIMMSHVEGVHKTTW